MDKENLLVKGLSELGLTITEEQIEKFDKYYEMLIETNKVMNLTSITEYDEVIIKHFIDSLLVVNIFDINQSKKMIDVGTGAGFPGIPIKIMFPHLQITLLDSLNKRLKFLNNVIDELGLDSIENLMHELGDIQEQLKIIHIAGTNGKGSVCAYLDAMLRAEGKSTGLFTSPHLVKMNERIVLNGKQISDEDFCEVFEETMQAVRRMQDAGLEHPTFFEFLFAMAMKAYDRAGMEYIVLETGLGGRLDATSSVEPVACVITSIGLDHMEYLGDTVEQIAGEKAGIIRP